MPGFDVYPIYGWNRPEKLNWVDQGVRELRAYAGVGKPLYVWTETLAGGFGDKANPVTGLEMRNEVYQAIIGGATAIGYFTHRFKPTFSEFGVPEENQAAMLEINQQLARLAPVILNGEPQRKASITIAGDLDSRIMTREYEGDTYVFALNLDMDRREGEATVSLEGIEAGASVEVIDEDRTISAGEGQFTDAFAPLAVHIYRIRG